MRVLEFASPGIRMVGGWDAFRPIASFIAVGGAGAAAFFLLSSMAVAHVTVAPSWTVSAFCYLLLVGPVYLLHRRFTFGSSAPHGRALPRYVAVQLSGLALTTLFSAICYDVLALPTGFAALLVTALTSGVNFMVLRAWAFRSI